LRSQRLLEPLRESSPKITVAALKGFKQRLLLVDVIDASIDMESNLLDNALLAGFSSLTYLLDNDVLWQRRLEGDLAGSSEVRMHTTCPQYVNWALRMKRVANLVNGDVFVWLLWFRCMLYLLILRKLCTLLLLTCDSQANVCRNQIQACVDSLNAKFAWHLFASEITLFCRKVCGALFSDRWYCGNDACFHVALRR
jgi:hypothetical protein